MGGRARSEAGSQDLRATAHKQHARLRPGTGVPAWAHQSLFIPHCLHCQTETMVLTSSSSQEGGYDGETRYMRHLGLKSSSPFILVLVIHIYYVLDFGPGTEHTGKNDIDKAPGPPGRTNTTQTDT